MYLWSNQSTELTKFYLSIEKAYNFVSCGFLLTTLKKEGFASKQRNWTLYYLLLWYGQWCSLALINGVATGFPPSFFFKLRRVVSSWSFIPVVSYFGYGGLPFIGEQSNLDWWKDFVFVNLNTRTYWFPICSLQTTINFFQIQWQYFGILEMSSVIWNSVGSNST